MEIQGENHENKVGILAHWWCWLKDFPNRAVAKFVQFASLTKKIGQEDPRRVIHSLKVGFALTLVSLFYYFKPLYKNFGVSAMWAVLTVVVVFEFSVGATIGKGINRGLATLLAGALGIGAHHLASMTGNVGEPLLIGTFVFLQAVVSTFIRFFPRVKARYDYGLMVFILTFCLVSISGFRMDEILVLAHRRLSTVLIGGCTCVMVSIFVFPVWSGEDLHNLIADHIEKLENCIEGFGEEFFLTSELKNDKAVPVTYRTVSNSKSTEETLANFARWEPGHGKFMYFHPWKQYLKIGNLTRQCARRIEALNCYLNSEIRIPRGIREKFRDPCTNMCKESGQALKELSLAIRKMTMPSSPSDHVMNSKMAAQNLKSLLTSDSWEKDTNLLQVMPLAAIASLLIEVVLSVEEIAESVNELASMANFSSSLDKNNVPNTTEEFSGGERKCKENQMSGCLDHVIIPVCGLK
ncbi:OLC1v1004770C1 [Oldenlandia corymbosa var. corymbosa]|uniref:OLC1v1004770C1 n=1 Tax=Oldenlandia corymbosa var. corymbosa TaxID=529605 RepID=A0AAV1DGH8_OLDCO|nr:OLC1v1004770C1 [Oldenlandia corymbosa var. corymbosa]